MGGKGSGWEVGRWGWGRGINFFCVGYSGEFKKKDECGEIGGEKKNFDDQDNIFHFEGENKRMTSVDGLIL